MIPTPSRSTAQDSKHLESNSIPGASGNGSSQAASSPSQAGSSKTIKNSSLPPAPSSSSPPVSRQQILAQKIIPSKKTQDNSVSARFAADSRAGVMDGIAPRYRSLLLSPTSLEIARKNSRALHYDSTHGTVSREQMGIQRKTDYAKSQDSSIALSHVSNPTTAVRVTQRSEIISPTTATSSSSNAQNPPRQAGKLATHKNINPTGGPSSKAPRTTEPDALTGRSSQTSKSGTCSSSSGPNTVAATKHPIMAVHKDSQKSQPVSLLWEYCAIDINVLMQLYSPRAN